MAAQDGAHTTPLLLRLHDTVTVLRETNDGLLAQVAHAHRSGAASPPSLRQVSGKAARAST